MIPGPSLQSQCALCGEDLLFGQRVVPYWRGSTERSDAHQACVERRLSDLAGALDAGGGSIPSWP